MTADSDDNGYRSPPYDSDDEASESDGKFHFRSTLSCGSCRERKKSRGVTSAAAQNGVGPNAREQRRSGLQTARICTWSRRRRNKQSALHRKTSLSSSEKIQCETPARSVY